MQLSDIKTGPAQMVGERGILKLAMLFIDIFLVWSG